MGLKWKNGLKLGKRREGVKKGGKKSATLVRKGEWKSGRMGQKGGWMRGKKEKNFEKWNCP